MNPFSVALLLLNVTANSAATIPITALDPFFKAIISTKRKIYPHVPESNLNDLREAAKLELDMLSIAPSSSSTAVEYLQNNAVFMEKAGLKTLVELRQFNNELCEMLATRKQSD